MPRVRRRCQPHGSAVAALAATQPSPAQRGPAGDFGTRKSCWKRTSLSRLGCGRCSQPACACLRGEGAIPPEGAGTGAGVLCSSKWGVRGAMWGEMGRLVLSFPFLAYLWGESK